MPYCVADKKNLIPTSSGSAFTNAVGNLDDAECITIFVSSSAGTASTGATAAIGIQISQFDPDISIPTGTAQSTQWYNLINPLTSAAQVISTGTATVLSAISFRGLRLSNLTSAVLNEVIAVVSKQIFV